MAFFSTLRSVGILFAAACHVLGQSASAAAESECFVSGISYSGHDLFQIRDGEADTVKACQEFCQELQDCEYFTYDSSKKACYLKDVNAPEGRKKVVDHFVTGPKYCEGAAPTSGTPGCYESGIAFDGHDLEPSGESGVESVAECQVRCQEHAGCHYFTYVSSSEVCYLKDDDALEGEAVVEDNIMSGPKYCSPQSRPSPGAEELAPPPLPVSRPVASCFESGTAYDGHTVYRDLDGSVESPDDCQSLCQYIEGCEYFTFAGSTNGCYLKDGSAAARRRKIADETIVSGPRSCDSSLPSPTPEEPEPPASVPPTHDGTNTGINLHKGSAVEVTAEKSPERFTVTVGSCYTITVDKQANELQVKGTRTHKGTFPTEPLKNGAFGLLIYPEGERLAAVYDYQTASGDWGSMTVRTPSSPCNLLQVALTGIPANQVFQGVRAFLTDDMKNLGS